MKVRVLRQYLTAEEIDARGSSSLRTTIYRVTPENEYEAIGIFFNQPYFGSGVQFQVVNDDGSLSWIPQKMLEITDPLVRPDWVLRRLEHSLALASPELFYLHDDLSESVPEAKRVLVEMLSRYDAKEELRRTGVRSAIGGSSVPPVEIEQNRLQLLPLVDWTAEQRRGPNFLRTPGVDF